MLAALKVRSIEVRIREVRSAKDLSQCGALIIPGGESTVMMKLLKETGLDQKISDCVRSGMPVFATCAGAILLSDSHLGLLDITVDRNAYGSQLQSFSAEVAVEGMGSVEAVFIRAPVISRVGEGVTVLAQHKEHPVLVQKGNMLVATFHPEIGSDATVHAAFLNYLTP